MNLPPETFATLCGIADYPDEKTKEEWLTIWEKTIKEFLTWLIEEGNLDQKQLLSLEETLGQVTSGNKKNLNIFGIIASLLPRNHKSLIMKKFADLLLSHLIQFYTKLKEGLNLEQKQLYNSFISINQKLE